MQLFKAKKKLPIPNPYFVLGGFTVLIVFSYLFADRKVSEWMLGAPHLLTLFCEIFNLLTGPEVCIIVLPLLFYVFRAFTKKESLANLFLLMAITVNATQVLISPIKMLFGRYRPDLWISQHLYGFDGLTHADIEMSFPSGHAAAIAGILFSLACIYPKKFPSLAVLTFVLSFCRIVVEKHYISDVLASMLLALFVSQWIYISLKRAKVSF